MEIQDFPDYLIFEDGNVLSLKRNIFLKSANTGDGYVYVVLYKDGKHKNFKIHRLIAIHYIPNPENKRCVDHINRIRDDNRVENLRWVTDSENRQNTGIYKTNTSGEEYICYDKSNDRWKYQKMINGKKTQKHFKTFDEAITFKNLT